MKAIHGPEAAAGVSGSARARGAGVAGRGRKPYSIRDRLIEQLKEESYGPRPLDFELLRKLADQAAGRWTFSRRPSTIRSRWRGEAKCLRAALFEPRGQVIRPPVRHPDRPQAWIVIETAENIDADDAARKAAAIAASAKIEMAEEFRGIG